MSLSGFVRVFQPADVTQAAQVKLALGAVGIPFVIENENYMNAVGLPYSIGAQRIYVLVPRDFAEDAREVLDDWFEGPDPAEPA